MFSRPLIRERVDEVYLRESRTDELLKPKRILSLSKLQKEQSHIHSVTAYCIIGDTPVRRQELLDVFGMAS